MLLIWQRVNWYARAVWVKDHIGYTQEEYKSLSNNLFEKLVHPDDRKTQLDAYAFLMNNPVLLFKECQIRIKKKNEDYVHILLRLSILEMDENQKPKMLLNTATDISEIVELRMRLKEELRKMEIISFKNSHELRGPVTSILGLIHLIDHESSCDIPSHEIIQLLKMTVVKLDSVIREINDHTY